MGPKTSYKWNCGAPRSWSQITLSYPYIYNSHSIHGTIVYLPTWKPIKANEIHGSANIPFRPMGIRHGTVYWAHLVPVVGCGLFKSPTSPLESAGKHCKGELRTGAPKTRWRHISARCLLFDFKSLRITGKFAKIEGFECVFLQGFRIFETTSFEIPWFLGIMWRTQGKWSKPVERKTSGLQGWFYHHGLQMKRIHKGLLPGHPNTSSEGVWDMFWGVQSYLLSFGLRILVYMRLNSLSPEMIRDVYSYVYLSWI